MEIRPYTQADWPRIAAVHDAARPMELHLAGLDGAFLPPVCGSPAGGAV